MTAPSIRHPAGGRPARSAHALRARRLVGLVIALSGTAIFGADVGAYVQRPTPPAVGALVHGATALALK